MADYPILDTSSLMNVDPLFFIEFERIFPRCTVVIPRAVLQELDGLKKSHDRNVDFIARDASRKVEHILDTVLTPKSWP